MNTKFIIGSNIHFSSMKKKTLMINSEPGPNEENSYSEDEVNIIILILNTKNN